MNLVMSSFLLDTECLEITSPECCTLGLPASAKLVGQFVCLVVLD